MDEKIKKLLDSDLEEDNLIGWEMIAAKRVPYTEVLDYIENTKVPTHWERKYIWNGNKFIKNVYLSNGPSTTTINYSGYTSTMTGDFLSSEEPSVKMREDEI